MYPYTLSHQIKTVNTDQTENTQQINILITKAFKCTQFCSGGNNFYPSSSSLNRPPNSLNQMSQLNAEEEKVKRYPSSSSHYAITNTLFKETSFPPLLFI